MHTVKAPPSQLQMCAQILGNQLENYVPAKKLVPNSSTTEPVMNCHLRI